MFVPKKRTIPIAATLLLWFMAVHGQRLPRMEWGFQNDNDLYLLNKQDQYYTNGILLSVRKAADSTALAPRELNRIWGISGGQKLYTAYTGQIHEIEEVDRPITAYLFLGINRTHYYVNESMLALSVELGTIGSRALGKEAQESVHKAFNLYEISGWEYQLKSAFGVDLGAEYAKRLYRNTGRWFDITAYAAGKLGLNHTHMAAAPIFRIGRLNPLHATAYFSSRLQAHPANIANELFLYFKPMVSWVAYDATIQGGLLREDKGPVTFRPARWVFANQVGLVYARRAFTCSLQYVFSSKESPSMFFRHRYGSLGISYRY
ncbi:lipid A deacylase LpxR family protein [Parapedobacter lycopersici]|uniref:lipid A deacylase LpxR family protein n=1 Tax=Parapedobacter lycopersici TaxID=1864939 RepID=UPI00214D440B|nr:lipid A deacylase LpxR family protein [Parapedobacter lycopersici]